MSEQLLIKLSVIAEDGGKKEEVEYSCKGRFKNKIGINDWHAKDRLK